VVSRRVVRRHDRSDESSDRRITGCDRQSSRRIFRTSFPRGALLGRRSPRNRSGRTSPFRLLDLARRSMLARIKLTTWSRKLVEHPPASSPHPLPILSRHFRDPQHWYEHGKYIAYARAVVARIVSESASRRYPLESALLLAKLDLTFRLNAYDPTSGTQKKRADSSEG